MNCGCKVSHRAILVKNYMNKMFLQIYRLKERPHKNKDVLTGYLRNEMAKLTQ